MHMDQELPDSFTIPFNLSTDFTYDGGEHQRLFDLILPFLYNKGYRWDGFRTPITSDYFIGAIKRREVYSIQINYDGYEPMIISYNGNEDNNTFTVTEFIDKFIIDYSETDRLFDFITQ